MTYANNKTSKKDTWPNFFIVGAARAGTTTLYKFLGRAPGINLPKIKEPRYFLARSKNQDIYGRIAVGSTENYLRLFANVDAIAIGETTPEYLYHNSAANKIRERVPIAKIVITLRNPIERALSHYLLLKTLLNVKYTFDDMVKSEWANKRHDLATSLRSGRIIIECGFYSHGIDKYLELLASDRIMIIIFEEWTKNALNTINRIIEFLGVNYKFDDSITIQKENASRNYTRTNAFLSSVVENSLLLSNMFLRLPASARNLLRNIKHRQLSIRSFSSTRECISDELDNF